VHNLSAAKVDAAVGWIDKECARLKDLAERVRADASAVLVQAYNSRLKYLNEERDVLLAMQKSLSDPLNEVGPQSFPSDGAVANLILHGQERIAKWISSVKARQSIVEKLIAGQRQLLSVKDQPHSLDFWNCLSELNRITRDIDVLAKVQGSEANLASLGALLDAYAGDGKKVYADLSETNHKLESGFHKDISNVPKGVHTCDHCAQPIVSAELAVHCTGRFDGGNGNFGKDLTSFPFAQNATPSFTGTFACADASVLAST
jgi:hypothetical protein